MKKIIVVHPFRQHSFRLATALNEDNNLFAYCTTVYDKKKSLMMLVKLLLKGDLLKKANGRKCDGFSDEQVHLFCQIRGFAALVLNRYCKNINIVRAYQRYLYKCFGKHVAKYAIANDVDAIIAFDTTAAECFSYIKKRNKNIKCILDMSAISRPYAKLIYENEERNLDKPYYHQSQKYLWNENVMKYMLKEIELADWFIAASSFTAESVIYCGRDKSSIQIIPYGIDTSSFCLQPDNCRSKGILNILFVGHIDYNKGVHYLLEALDKFDSVSIKLDMYGVYHSDSDIFIEGVKKSNVHFHGFVTPDRLGDIYKEADVFIFPTTNDGYGFVVLEAMACGVPVLCSTNAGACELIEDGVNGFRFESGDVERIRELIQWCIDNRDKLPQMGLKAHNKVKNYTWECYNYQINEFINRVV